MWSLTILLVSIGKLVLSVTCFGRTQILAEICGPPANLGGGGGGFSNVCYYSRVLAGRPSGYHPRLRRSLCPFYKHNKNQQQKQRQRKVMNKIRSLTYKYNQHLLPGIFLNMFHRNDDFHQYNTRQQFFLREPIIKTEHMRKTTVAGKGHAKQQKIIFPTFHFRFPDFLLPFSRLFTSGSKKSGKRK